MVFEERTPFGLTLQTADLEGGTLPASGTDGASPHRSEREEPSLDGLRILLVEDEFLLALEVEAALMGLGCFVAGPFAKLSKAMNAARSMPLDGAVLDINLNGEMVYPLAEYLDTAGVPFVFLTGYVPSDLPERFRRFRRLQKPLHAAALRTTILDMRRGGHSSGAS